MMMAVLTCSSAAVAAVLPLCEPGPFVPAGQGVQSRRQARLQQPLLSCPLCACSHAWPLLPVGKADIPALKSTEARLQQRSSHLERALLQGLTQVTDRAGSALALKADDAQLQVTQMAA